MNEELSTADLGFSLDELRGRSLEELSRRGAIAARWVSVRVKQGAPILARLAVAGTATITIGERGRAGRG
jgi:hypothetical protein